MLNRPRSRTTKPAPREVIARSTGNSSSSTANVHSEHEQLRDRLLAMILKNEAARKAVGR